MIMDIADRVIAAALVTRIAASSGANSKIVTAVFRSAAFAFATDLMR
jgi:hypothetical protein